MKKLLPGAKIEFGFGVMLRADGRHLSGPAAKLGIDNIIDRAAHLFGGCTLVATQGDWIDATGKHFRETGRTLVVLVESIQPDIERRIKELIFCIKHALDQQAVAVTVTEVRTGII